jgi:hypothetical protein
VRWNSEAGRVSGTIITIHARDFPAHLRAPPEDAVGAWRETYLKI